MSISSISEKIILFSKKVILDVVKKRQRSQDNCIITYFNQNCFNIYSKDPEYRNLIDKVFLTYIDGTGIRLALKLFKVKTSARFNASDLNEKLFNYFIVQKYKVYIVGGNIPEKLITGEDQKGLNLNGYTNGFFNRDEEQRLNRKYS